MGKRSGDSHLGAFFCVLSIYVVKLSLKIRIISNLEGYCFKSEGRRHDTRIFKGAVKIDENGF